MSRSKLHSSNPYDRHERKEEQVEVSVSRFTVDGKPTCFSWAGNSEHPPEQCRFFFTKNMGAKRSCVFLNVDLRVNISDKFIRPHKNCPLWKE